MALIEKGFITADAIVIEHYENLSLHGTTFDIVTFSSNNIPSWESIKLADACSLLSCDKSEFDIFTERDPRLTSEIERIRNYIDPFSGSPTPENPDVVNRRADIEARMLGKRELSDAIDSGAGETELHHLLKSDLSIFAEVYADSGEEYICFSEFPVEDGFVDFAIFSGRSRMDVTLIEIKGADFHLTTTGSYKNFSSKTNEAIQQIRTRVGIVYRNMEKFRREVHVIRQRIEAGETLHGSFVGPHARLEVDPNKDINIRCVVIAGRTRDDLEESRQRHDFEWTVKPPVKVETWDTFLRKLRRL
ncbi:Shedu immune nuclease family protein [Burkholderia seminalis]|uniref:Shedu immune nuclease family protein n=1 Tax=Burkholderia seminalis TaxID=488731 RepID=UPI0031E1F277